MDSRWFSEDRKLPKTEQRKAVEDTTTALQNSTLLVRRLKEILEAEIEKTYTHEEDYEGIAWDRKVLTMFARRSTLKEIIKLLP